jgi:Tol biopolymer transport system component
MTLVFRFLKAGAAATIVALLAACTHPGGVSPLPPNSTQSARHPHSFAGRDGQIAFVQTPAGTNGLDVYAMNPDGSHQRQLTNFSVLGDFVEYPHWSPDGTKIVFTRFNSAVPDYELWLMNADGTGQHLLFAPTTAYEFPVAIGGSFSPDGNRVVFSTDNGSGGLKIFRIDTDGTQLVQLTQQNPLGETHDVHPAYSPDGATIVFGGFFRGGYLERLYAMNATDGSNLHAISDPALGANGPDFSPDGQRIAFWTYENQAGFGSNEEIWTSAAGGGSPTQLTHNNDSHQVPYLQANHDGLPSWAPAGDAIVFERDSGDFSSSGIYSVRSDGSDLKLLRHLAISRHFHVRYHPAARFAIPAHHAMNNMLLLQSGGGQPAWGSAPPVQ